MIELKEHNKVVITMDRDIEDIVDMQNAIIDLLQCYNYKDIEVRGETMYSIIDLLSFLIPSKEQQIKAFELHNSFIEIPKSLSETNKHLIVEAIKNIHKDEKNDNPILQVLRQNQ